VNKPFVIIEAINENVSTFNQHFDMRYDRIGRKERTDFEIKAKSFAIGE